MEDKGLTKQYKEKQRKWDNLSLLQEPHVCHSQEILPLLKSSEESGCSNRRERRIFSTEIKCEAL